jgi:predicted TIM-barrel fold metal-dependent hydrolase
MIRHTCRKSDTLSSIARLYYADLQAASTLASYNGIKESDIAEGMILDIPPVLKAAIPLLAYAIEANDTLVSIAQTHYRDQAAAASIAHFNRLPDSESIPAGVTSLLLPKKLDTFVLATTIKKEPIIHIVNYARQRPLQVRFIELDDLHFAEKGLIPCLSGDNHFAGLIADVFAFINKPENSRCKLIIFGHADTAGNPSDNFRLSGQRAQVIKTIIDDDFAAFWKLINNVSLTCDLKRILNALTDFYDWNCEAGKEDERQTPEYQAAIKSFQKQYNSRFKKNIPDTGKADENTWNGVFDVYQRLIDDQLKVDGTDRLPVPYDDETRGIYACGESFPIEQPQKTNYRSKTNRRIELAFVDSEMRPVVQKPEDTGKTIPASLNQAHDPEATELVPIKPKERKSQKTTGDFVVPWFIDCHMHINDAHCAPLPVIWVQNALIQASKPTWEKLEKHWFWSTMSRIATKDLAKITKLDMTGIALEAMKESQKALDDPSLEKYLGPAEKRKRLMICMPMDMDLAHWDGYEGKEIYQEKEDGSKGYFEYAKGKRKWIAIDAKSYKSWIDYPTQLLEANKSLTKNRNHLFSFYHYDPRRWQGEKIGNARLAGRWDQPFAYIIQAAKSKASLKDFRAIGFKLYTALGYRPNEYSDIFVTSMSKPEQKKKLKLQLPYLSNFYKECADNNIPIICHGSSGGVSAHDYELYYDYLFPGDSASRKDKREFYNQHYISPFAWESVLRDFPNLRLCLAHFGGEEYWGASRKKNGEWVKQLAKMMETYENFYVDISYFLFKGFVSSPAMRNQLKELLDEFPNIHKKILFGTDWYLIGLERAKFGKYHNFVQTMCEEIGKIKKELLAYFMVLNPKAFLNLDSLADSLYEKTDGECDIRKFVKEEMYSTIDQFRNL